MRQARKNRRKMWYKTYIESQPIYILDENDEKIIAETIDGVDYYLEEGQTEPTYSEAVSFEGTILLGGGNVQLTSYGINLGEYEGLMVLPTISSPIDEKSLIWLDNEPREGQEADYVVARKSIALNSTSFLLKKVVKNENNED